MTKNEPTKRWISVHQQLLDQGFKDNADEQRQKQGVLEHDDCFRAREPGETVVLPQEAGLLFPESETAYGRAANVFPWPAFIRK